MDISELNSLLKSLEIKLSVADKNLFLNYSEKRGLEIKELYDDISKIGIDKLLSVRAPSPIKWHSIILRYRNRCYKKIS